MYRWFLLGFAGIFLSCLPGAAQMDQVLVKPISGPLVLKASLLWPDSFPARHFPEKAGHTNRWRYAAAEIPITLLPEGQPMTVVLPNAWLLHYVVEERAGSIVRLLDSGITGRGLTTSERNAYDYRLRTHAFLPSPGSTVTVKLRQHEQYGILFETPVTVTVFTETDYIESRMSRNFWQALFLGGLLLMACYNLFLWFAVRDASYFHYVISIVGIGLYFAFYYGFGMEYLWPRSPRWDLWSYTVIVPFTGLARLWFTRTYLHAPSLLPRLNRWLNWLSALMGATLLAGLCSYIFSFDLLQQLVTVIGVLNTIILGFMLIAGIQGYRSGYYPALFFTLANAPLVVGAILFILRELHLLPDTWVTRYFVQIGVMFQVVLFAFGLASRYNQTRAELAQGKLERERMALDAEREKKTLIERQRQQLQQQVNEQTHSLRVQNEQLQQLNALKDKLFSVITHDLRNPLATMQSFLKLLTEHHDKLSEAEKQQLTTEAKDSLDHLNRLLYYLLQWSKSQMNLLAFQPEIMPAATVLQKNVRMLHLQAHLKNITLKVEAAPDTMLFGDAHMVDFVLRNLLSNAIKFSAQGSEVMVKAEAVPDGALLHIEDHGVGMTEETVKEIMEAHVGASRRGTFRERGTGLGLLICKDFILKHGGIFSIKSTPDAGTAVSVFFPAGAA